jgi:hypothetical protein
MSMAIAETRLWSLGAGGPRLHCSGRTTGGRRHTVASDTWSTGSASTKGDEGVKHPCPLSLAPGTPRCSVGKCAQPTTVPLES